MLICMAGLSYGATVHGMPLMNILVASVHEPSAVLAIVDCKFVPFVLNLQMNL
jgi:hypothetical protein